MAKASTAVAKSEATALAKAETTALATAPDISVFDGMGTGFENVTARDLLIPRLTILQGLSPQVIRGQSEYDEDAKVGDIYDVGLMEGFPDGLVFLPAYHCEQWLEWAPRNTGKGLQHIHETGLILQEATKDEKGRNVLPNGNYIQETYQLYGYNVTGGWRKSFIPFVSTQRKKCKLILTLAANEKILNRQGQEVTPPLFYRAYALTTVPESNAEGNWMGWKIAPGQSILEMRPDAEDFLRNDLKGFRESLAAGTVHGDIATMEREAGRDMSNNNAPM